MKLKITQPFRLDTGQVYITDDVIEVTWQEAAWLLVNHADKVAPTDAETQTLASNVASGAIKTPKSSTMSGGLSGIVPPAGRV